MKRSELGFNLLSIPLDALMLLMAGISAFYLRLQYRSFIGPVLYSLEIKEFLLLILNILPIIIVIFAFFGLYNLSGVRKFTSELARIALAVASSVSIVVILFFFDRTIFPSRFIILAAAVLAILYIVLGRTFLRLLQRYYFSKGFGLHKVVAIIAEGSNELQNIRRLYTTPEFGYSLVDEIVYDVHAVEKLKNHKNIDEIIQTNTGLSDDANLQILEYARSQGIQFTFVPNLFEMQRNVVEVGDLAGLPMISIKNTPLDGYGKVAKRITDILGSSLAIIILSPVYLFVFLAVKFGSPGPAIYSALRGGYGKDFKFYKFRSMYTHMSPGLGGEEAEKLRRELWEKNDRGGKSAPFLKIKNDPRVTPIGKFIRKSKLDEIPQFWNVLKGDMSLVGPRAHVLDEVDKYRSRYQRMFSIKPGIFGMSQLEQLRAPDLAFEEEIRLNTYYIENWSLMVDIKILLKTLYLLLFGKKDVSDY